MEQGAASGIISEMKRNIVGREIPAGKNIGVFLKEEIKAALEKIMETEKIDFWKRIEGTKVPRRPENGAVDS